jgi:hypothetical protein
MVNISDEDRIMKIKLQCKDNAEAQNPETAQLYPFKCQRKK